MVSLGQILKLPKTRQKPLQRHVRVVLFKKWLQKTRNIKKMTSFRKSPKLPTMQRLYRLCKMVSLAQKLKLPKTCQKRLQRHARLCLCKKTALKTPNYNIPAKISFRKSLKLGTMQRLQALQNDQFSSKIKIAKSVPKTSLETRQSCSVQKPAPKNTLYSGNDKFWKITKIGHNEKGIQALKNGQFHSKIKIA